MCPEAGLINVWEGGLQLLASPGIFLHLTFSFPSRSSQSSLLLYLTLTPPSLPAPPQPEASEALRSFDYPPVAAVTVSYPKTAIRDDRKDAAGDVPGFGQLHPRSQVRGRGGSAHWDWGSPRLGGP